MKRISVFLALAAAWCLGLPAAQQRGLSGWALRFEVTGRVTDPQGRPLSNVTITANCGEGTLLPTGRTNSQTDGTYTLRFRPGMLIRDDEQERVALQAATIRPSKPGWFETNLHRQGGLLMSDRLPRANERTGWEVDPHKVVLPGKPYHLDFFMAPAAMVKGKLVDARNRPLAFERVYMGGPDLPPSSSVLGGFKTDKDGFFEYDGVPTGWSWWFVLPAREDLQSPELKFDTAGVHEVELLLEKPNGKDSLKVQTK